MADCREVAVQLEKMMVVLRLGSRVKVIVAAKVGEGSLLAELYRLALDEDGQGCRGRLFRVNFVVLELIGTEFAGGKVKFKDLGECCNQAGLLLQAGQVAAEG